MDTVAKLLKRTNIKIPFSKFINEVERSFSGVGKIQRYEPISEGYEDANFLITSEKGRYVLKVFADFRSKENIKDYVKVIEEAKKSGVETLRLIKGKGGFLQEYQETGFMLTQFFDGVNFEDKSVGIRDMLRVTNSLAKLNTLDFEVTDTYDSWGNKNLIKEFEKANLKNDKVIKEIAPVVEQLKDLVFEGFSKSVIHGDMQRKHVLSDGNKYCIIDYGCMRYDYKVYELSVFLAWFCLGMDAWANRKEIMEKVLEKYTKIHPLSKDEIASLELLIAAAYAAYYLKTTQLIEQGDDSSQTVKWHTQAKEMLRKSMEWSSL